MPVNAITSKPRRARSADQKESRRRDILAAATAMMAEADFEQVTMQALAQRAGLAKGTLYLYVRTREEVFLALFLDALHRWCAHIAGAVRPGMDDEEVVRTLSTAVRSDPLYLDLSARLTAVIERNVPMDVVISAKREMLGAYRGLAAHLADVLRLSPADATRFGTALLALLRGALELDTNVLAEEPDLPEDVAALLSMASFDTVFPDGLRLVLAGLRAGNAP